MMNSCVGNMLSVIMDGIKDIDMVLDYADMAEEQNYADWFVSVARKRMSLLREEYDQVVKAIGLSDKVRAGDEIAKALHAHITNQMDMLEKRF